MKKYLLLFLAALGLLSSAPKAEAYTNKEIAAKGKAFRTLLSGWDLSNNGGQVPSMTEGDVNVSLDPSTGYIKLSMSFDGTLIGWNDPIEMLIDVNGTTATIKYNAYVQPIGTGETEVISRTTYRKAVRQWFQMVTNKTVSGTTYYVGLIPRTFSYPTQNDTSGKQMTGTVSYDSSSDTYTIDFGKFDLVYVHLVSNNAMAYYYDTNNDGSCNGTRYTYGNQNGLNYYNRDAVARHQGMSFTFYSPNATITDTKYDYNGKTKSNAQSRSYQANVRYDGEEFKIINWNNAGCPWYVDVKNNQFSRTKKDFSIYFEPNVLHTEVNPMEFAYGFTNTSDVTTLYAQFYGTNFNSLTYDIEGIPCEMDHEILHKTTNTSGWLDSNSNSTILKIKAIDFDDYQIIQNPLFTDGGMSYKNYLEKTKVTFTTPLEIDYSHGVKINKNSFGYGPISEKAPNDKYIYLNCNLENLQNTYYVDNYELYIMPEVTNPNYNSADFNPADGNGHVNGTLISKPEYFTYFPNYPEKEKINAKGTDDSENLFANNTYNLLIPETDLKAVSANGRYQLYVKTYYTEDSGLTPTFQSLTTLNSSDITTGVDDITGDKDEDAPAVYYNLNGVRMNGDALTPGIYIRRQGSTTSKVVIR